MKLLRFTVLKQKSSLRTLTVQGSELCFCFLLFCLFLVDFLAKYCIFSQEKLAEYKRAFEAVSERGFKPFLFRFSLRRFCFTQLYVVEV